MFVPGQVLHRQMSWERAYVVIPKSDQNGRSCDLDGDSNTVGSGSVWGNKRQSLKLTLVTTEKSFQYYGS